MPERFVVFVCVDKLLIVVFQALGEEVMTQIDELYQAITPVEEKEISVDEQLTVASQHLVEYFSSSLKEFHGTTCIL